MGDVKITVLFQFENIVMKSITDWSILLGILGVIAFFFGKIINEVAYTKENRYADYLEGMVYLSLVVIFPVLVLDSLNQKFHLFICTKWVVLVIQGIIVGIIGMKFIFYGIEKLDYKDVISKNMECEYKEKSKKLNIPSAVRRIYLSIVSKYIFTGKISLVTILIFALLQVWGFWNIIIVGTSISKFLSFLMIFASTSLMATLYGWSKVKEYPHVKVVLSDGTEKEGRLSKIEDDYINLIQKDDILHIKSDKVKYIQKRILKPHLRM